MRHIFLSLLLLVAFTSCKRHTDTAILPIKKNDLIGEWSSKSENEFLLFKDSVSLPSNFYLFSNWKLDSNQIKIYNIESKPRQDSVWVNYSIKSFSEDSLVVVSPAFSTDSSVTLYKRRSKAADKIKHIQLNRLIYPGEKSLFKINVNSDGEVLFKEPSQEKDSVISECSFDENEMKILNSMVERAKISELDSMYISGISDQDYYSLEISTIGSERTYSVIVDTGRAAPNLISRIITFIWSTTKLKCTPKYYNNWKMYYNPNTTSPT